MTTTMMEREELSRIIQKLPDDKVLLVLGFAKNIQDRFIDDLDEYEPNAETITAMREAEHPEKLKSYTGIEEMFRDFGVNLDRQPNHRI
jgi:hypothetical protein